MLPFYHSPTSGEQFWINLNKQQTSTWDESNFFHVWISTVSTNISLILRKNGWAVMFSGFLVSWNCVHSASCLLFYNNKCTLKQLQKEIKDVSANFKRHFLNIVWKSKGQNSVLRITLEILLFGCSDFICKVFPR